MDTGRGTVKSDIKQSPWLRCTPRLKTPDGVGYRRIAVTLPTKQPSTRGTIAEEKSMRDIWDIIQYFDVSGIGCGMLPKIHGEVNLLQSRGHVKLVQH